MLMVNRTLLGGPRSFCTGTNLSLETVATAAVFIAAKSGGVRVQTTDGNSLMAAFEAGCMVRGVTGISACVMSGVICVSGCDIALNKKKKIKSN